MSITGNTFNIDSQLYQVFKVFLYLVIPFTIGKTIKLGKFDSVVPIHYQT